MHPTPADIAGMIDHSLLAPAMTASDLEEGCALAVHHRVASVCILPYYLRRCADVLAGTPVRPSTTIGFPHGGHAPDVKAAETRQAIRDGAAEVDMVINIGQALSDAWDFVQRDIAAVIEPAHAAGVRVKVILETCYLDRDRKIRLCRICGEQGADWVKTSTGFGTAGATIEDVALMKAHVPPPVQVKAAGGIRDLDTVLAMRAAGATRIGCSRTAEVLAACRQRFAHA